MQRKELVVDSETTPAVLAELVAYQDDSVVSKTLIDTKTGTVTLFAFAQGQGLSEHTASFDAMVCVLDGTADLSIAGKPLQVGAGQMVIMPATIPPTVTQLSTGTRRV